MEALSAMTTKINHRQERMPKQFRIILLIFILSAPWLRPQVVLADTGPKPTMEFAFQQNLPDGQVTIKSGILYECDQSDCSDATELKQLGSQGFRCDALSCSALAYGFSDYHKLEIQFSDGKTRQSNIFKTAGFDSKYTVTIQPNDLLVEAQFSLMPSFAFGVIEILVACLCALMVIALIIGAILFFRQRSRKP